MCICIGKLWERFDPGKVSGLQFGVPDMLCLLLRDAVVEVRCAAVYSLGAFMGGKYAVSDAFKKWPEQLKDEEACTKALRDSLAEWEVLQQTLPAAAKDASSARGSEQASPSDNKANELLERVLSCQGYLGYLTKRRQLAMGDGGKAPELAQRDLDFIYGERLCVCANDASPLVRKELVIALGELVYYHQDIFLEISDQTRKRPSLGESHAYHPTVWSRKSSCRSIWRTVGALSRDPFPVVAEAALALKNYVKSRALFNHQLNQMMNFGTVVEEAGGTGDSIDARDRKSVV